ncbi:hypothetical protein K488DRAFT_87524 [Vararia minispora EC-137]|uniref:Uncharacterized protein n=1 Tax=Vararia minispora EC-137 TaxID=1314806 RepID=A0ACB8QGE0_9AGAM|nr:hypothetical protein K488DRAFT_87524 [Vararia minispora EC-137]
MPLNALPSAVPTPYYVIFGIIEPLLTVGGFAGALIDPLKTYNEQATQPPSLLLPTELPTAARVTVIQLGHACALLGLVNFFVLSALRTHLSSNPFLQEKIARALLSPLLLGDILHMALTIYALGDARWDFAHYTPTLWMIIVFGFGLFVPRAMWHMGVGRFVEARDGKQFRSRSYQVLKS